jgi:endoglycosylceramidase
VAEFGATGDPAVLAAMLERADRHMVGWQFWHFCGCEDPTTTGPGDEQALVRDPARAPEGPNIDRGKLVQLARPYPRVVAGTPLGWSLRDGVFRARWSTARVGAGAAGRRFGPRAATELAVPRRRFPRGYVARVRGGRVVSRAGARVLRVRAREGARQVRVTVQGR